MGMKIYIFVCMYHDSRYVYKRLKWLGSKELSLALTLVFISLWHGIWPGYYFNFSLEFIGLTAERTVSIF